MKYNKSDIIKVISSTDLDNGYRTRLAAIRKFGRLTFTGTYTRCGYRTENSDGILTYYQPIAYYPTLLLDNITCCGQKVTDHLWINYSRKFRQLGELEPGNKVSFTAKLGSYKKGYYTHRTKDYQLNSLKGVHIVTAKKNRDPLPLDSDTMVGYTMVNNVDFYLGNGRPYVQDFVTSYDYWAQKNTPNRTDSIAQAEYEADSYNNSYADDFVDSDDDHPNEVTGNDAQHSKLTKLSLKKRYTFVGKYSGIDYKSYRHHYTPQLEFSTIKYRNQTISPDLWFNYTKSFRELGQLHNGDLVQFNARVITSKENEGLSSETTYYKLGYPTRAHLVAKTDGKPRIPFPVDDSDVIVGYAMSLNGIDDGDFSDPVAQDYFCLDSWKEWELRCQLKNARSNSKDAKRLALVMLKYKLFKRNFNQNVTNLSTDYDDSNIVGMLQSNPYLSDRLFVTIYRDDVIDTHHYRIMTWQDLNARLMKFISNGSLRYHSNDPLEKPMEHLSFCRDLNIKGLKKKLLMPIVHRNFAVYFYLANDKGTKVSKLAGIFFKLYLKLLTNYRKTTKRQQSKLLRLYAVLGIRLMRDSRTKYSKINLSKQSTRNLNKEINNIYRKLDLTPNQKINDIRKASKYLDVPSINN